MARKVFEKQTIDLATGEVVSIVSEYSSKNHEKFFLGRTTEGIEWIRNFNNVTEIYLFLAMLSLENTSNNYVITLSAMQINEYSVLFKCSEVYIRKCLQNLIKNDFLVRVAKCNYLANPDTFYMGGSKIRSVKRLQYSSWKNK